ncbi:MAG: hypothetical protein M5U25_18995 [Planctomycetota bacterium]|nr:hypothetical protein [Planctomycetota bacterium]
MKTIDGAPVEGVLVYVSSDYPERRYYQGMAAEERVRQEIRYARWLELAQRQVATDAEGNYRVEGLAENVRYAVRAESPAWSIESANSNRGRTRPPAEIQFIARPATTLLVQVRYEDGKHVEHATIKYRARALSRESESYTRDAGPAELRLTPGEWIIYATSDQFGADDSRLRYRSSEVEVRFEAGQTLQPIELTLIRTPGIGGIIETPKGFSRLPLDVKVQQDPPSEPPNSENVERTLRSDVWSDGDVLRWRCHDLEPGCYRVMLFGEERVLDWADVTLAGNDAEHNLRMPQPSTETHIVIRVYSPEGELLRDPNISVDAYSKGGSHGYTPRVMPAEDGSIWLARNARGRDVEYQYYDITVSHTEHGQRTVRYEASSREVLDIHLQKPAWLLLNVTNGKDHPAGNVLEWSLWQSDGDRGSYRRLDKHGGRSAAPIRMGPVAPGEYELMLELSIGQFESYTLLRSTVSLRQGDNEFSESIPELCSLTIRAEDESKPPNLDLKSTTGGLNVDVSRGNFRQGVLTIPFLPAGTYLLKSSVGQMKVTLPTSSEVVFRPRPWDCLKLEIQPEGGVIEALGVKDGDLLIEIDGKAVGGERESLELQASFTRQSTTWVVMRNGVRTDVTFDGTALYAIMTNRDRDSREYLHAERWVRD